MTSGLSVGLDVGGTKVRGVLLDGEGLIRGDIKMPTRKGPDGVAATAIKAVKDLAEIGKIDPSELDTLGVGIPGIVNATSGAVIHAVNLGINGDGFPLGKILMETLGVNHVRVDNDVNVAALGASSILHVRGDAAYLSIGTGLAAGIIVNDRIYRGVAGAAGEVGHIPTDPNGKLCACGQRGCIETVASGQAIDAAWPTPDGHAPAALFAAADAGDPRAIEIRDAFATGIAQTIQILAQTYDPDVIVVGGGVSGLGAPLMDTISQALCRLAEPSDFLRSLDMPGRLRTIPADSPVAAIGAALIGTN